MSPPPPGSIRTLGTLNLVFAGLGVAGVIMGYAMYFGGMDNIGGHRNVVVEAARQSPGYMSYLRVSFVTGALGVIALAAAGIGLHRMKMWGRKLSIAYAFYGIASVIAGFLASQHFLADVLARSSEPAAKAGATGGLIGGIIGIGYPAVLLVFMLKKDVREAFERAAEPPIPPARLG